MKVKLSNVVLAFPHLFELDRFDRFSATAIFEPGSENEQRLKSAIKQVAQDKWGKKAPQILKTLRAQNRLCLQDGDVKAQYAGFEGNLFVPASSKDIKPVVKDQDGRTDILPTDGKIYPGLIVNMMIDVWAQDSQQWGKRVNAGLLGVQRVRDGERLAGGETLAEDDFEAVPEAELGDTDAFGEDETGFDEGADDDDIPF